VNGSTANGFAVTDFTVTDFTATEPIAEWPGQSPSGQCVFVQGRPCGKMGVSAHCQISSCRTVSLG
jgi:hypothetical protein